MKHHWIVIFICAISFVQPTTGVCQPLPVREITLTALRGEWTFHTFDKKWCLNFLSDNQLIFNHESAKYSLRPSSFTVTTAEGTRTFGYQLSGDVLNLVLEGGTILPMEHISCGDTEVDIRGRFFFYPDSLSVSSLSFKAQNEFSVSQRWKDTSFVESVEGLMGRYRVDGNIIYLIFDDGTMETADIFDRDDNNLPFIISFQSQMYEKEQPLRSDTTIIFVGYFPPPPPPPPQPNPDPPPPCPSHSIPSSGTAPQAPPSGHQRPEGTTMLDQTENQRPTRDNDRGRR